MGGHPILEEQRMVAETLPSVRMINAASAPQGVLRQLTMRTGLF